MRKYGFRVRQPWRLLKHPWCPVATRLLMCPPLLHLPPNLYNGSEAGSYLRLTDFVYHSSLVLRVIKKKKKGRKGEYNERERLLLMPERGEEREREKERKRERGAPSPRGS